MTTISEIAPDIFSICTYIEQADLQFRQFLIRDEQPLLYHTGTRRMFERVRDAVGQVMDPKSLRWIAFSHFEADECGALNFWLQEARDAKAACSQNGALVSVGDYAFSKVRPLGDGETLTTGAHTLRFLATPHLPHGWDAGHLYDDKTGVLLCSDLLHQNGDVPAVSHGEPGRGHEGDARGITRHPAGLVRALDAADAVTPGETGGAPSEGVCDDAWLRVHRRRGRGAACSGGHARGRLRSDSARSLNQPDQAPVLPIGVGLAARRAATPGHGGGVVQRAVQRGVVGREDGAATRRLADTPAAESGDLLAGSAGARLLVRADHAGLHDEGATRWR